MLLDVEKDGNCLFRALSFTMYGNQTEHISIRNQVVDHIVNNWEQYENFPEKYYNDKKEYETNMKKLGEWASDLELSVANEIFKIKIELYQVKEIEQTLLKHVYNKEKNYSKTVKIGYLKLSKH
jgi:hypothetical protein